jgi:hypothetical protein
MNLVHKTFIRLGFCLLLAGGINSRVSAQSDVWVAPTFGFGTNFNLDDVFLTFNGGIESPKANGSVTAGFALRPGSKKVQIEQPGDVIFQYRERRYMLSLGLEKRVKMIEFSEETSLQGLVMLHGGFTFGDFRGTAMHPSNSLLLSPGAGFGLRLKYALVKLGYQYLPLETSSISPHRVFIGINIIPGDT